MVLLTGCTAGGYSSSSSNQGVAQISAFALSHDSIPALARTQFRIYERGLDSIGDIINPDSLPVGTPLNKVHPTYLFYATPSVARITISAFRDTSITRINPDSVFVKNITTRDTLNFDADSIFLYVVSADGTRTKTYRIQPLVHRVDPNKYVWRCMKQQVYPAREGEEQALFREEGQLMLYVSDGLQSPRLYTCPASSAKQGADWTASATTGLPSDARVRQIVRDDAHFYYGQDRAIYSSEDGLTWSEQSVPYTIMATLFAFPADRTPTVRPWFITRDDENLFAMSYWDETSAQMVEVQPLQRDSMPVSGFTVVHFTSASGRDRLVMLGGMTDDGVMLRKRWSLEHSSLVGTRVSDYSGEAMSFPLMVNAASVCYADRLLLFGAQDGDYQYIGRHAYESLDEGMHWTMIDTAACQMPASFEQRKNVCAIVDDRDVVIVGGSDNENSYSDLYLGRKNLIQW